MTRRKPLTWFDSPIGPIPGCDECWDMYRAPGFAEAVYSTAIERPESAADLMQSALNQYHAGRHRD